MIPGGVPGPVHGNTPDGVSDVAMYTRLRFYPRYASYIPRNTQVPAR